VGLTRLSFLDNDLYSLSASELFLSGTLGPESSGDKGPT